MLTHEQRLALFLEMHRNIEEAAAEAASQLMNSSPPDLVYPPNHGFTSEEELALARLPASPALESALRKVIASGASVPLFGLLQLFDGVRDPEHYSRIWLGIRLHAVPEDGEEDDEEPPFLYHQFGDTYWD